MTRIRCLLLLSVALVFGSSTAGAGGTLVILTKKNHTLALVDPTNLSTMATVEVGPDPHEVVVSDDGRLAFASNYGGPGSQLHTLSVVDLVERKALAPVDLGALHSAHGLCFAQGKVYFTAETSKVIGSYDPKNQKIDWVLGIGQDRTHMIQVRDSGRRIFTANVNSDSIAILEETDRPMALGRPPGAPAGPPGPPPGGPRLKDWRPFIIPVGKGPEGFDVSPDGRELWAANSHDTTVSVVDVAEHRVVATIPSGVNFANRLKFTPDGKRVLISSLGSGDLTVMDVARRTVVKKLPLGKSAAGILMPPDDHRAFVALSRDNAVAVIDLSSLTEVGRIRTGPEPDGMAWVNGSQAK